MSASGAPWWKGKRGEWYVVVQAGLIFLVFGGPHTWHGLPAWTPPYTWLGAIVGAVLLLTGTLFVAAGIFGLGRNLTPLPYPKETATLVVTGAYRAVRHPIYCGLFLLAFGRGLWIHSWLTLGYALVLFGLLDLKSRREERWLRERFPDYPAYQRRVRKLIPFIY
jgi:protein-S-isoprenylcysteine O-methyltransferase Ste14